MPVHPIKHHGKIVGYQWGHHGKVYTTAEYGKQAKALAERQGKAAYANGYKGK